ncbi:hypothetical protein [Falsibacillus albus]|nr:hypothetical protein [Falsibacillus albus]
MGKTKRGNANAQRNNNAKYHDKDQSKEMVEFAADKGPRTKENLQNEK